MYPKKLPWFYTVLSILVLGSGLGLLIYSFYGLDYEWDYRFLIDYLWDFENHIPGLILQGLWVTMKVSFLSILFGSALGIVIGLLMIGRERVSKAFAMIFVDIFRNTPVLVQLYVMYFIVGTALDLSPEFSGVLTLSLFCSAYVADIFRGAVLELESGQLDAAKAMGLTPLQAARYVAAPQILRRMLPSLVGQFVSLVKDSSLVSTIAVSDLTKSALTIVSVSFKSFETWFMIAVIYCLLNYALSSYGRYLEGRLRVGGR